MIWPVKAGTPVLQTRLEPLHQRYNVTLVTNKVVFLKKIKIFFNVTFKFHRPGPANWDGTSIRSTEPFCCQYIFLMLAPARVLFNVFNYISLLSRFYRCNINQHWISSLEIHLFFVMKQWKQPLILWRERSYLQIFNCGETVSNSLLFCKERDNCKL